MSKSEPAVPIYIELALAASQPAAGTTGSILRSYLGILASYFESRGGSPDVTSINIAMSNLPGLQLQNQTRTHDDITVTAAGLAEGLATILASGWSAPVSSAAMLPLSRPLIDRLRRGTPTPAGNSFQATLVVLQRPPNGRPTLEAVTLQMALREDSNKPLPSCTLSVEASRITYSVIEHQAASIQAFVGDLRGQGLVANLEGTPGYLAVPFS